jgi:hypothetical protein
MDVWDGSERSPATYGRIRRLHGWKDFSLFVAQVLGGIVVAGSLVVGLLTSMGFTFSGSGKAIEDLRSADVRQDTSIAKLQRQGDLVDTRTEDIAYLVCAMVKRNQPGIILPRSCK